MLTKNLFTFSFSRSKSKRIAFTVILTLIFLVSVTKALDFAYISESDFKFSKILSHKLDPEVMVFGSSVANVHFNSNLIARKTGMSVYNAGMHGTFFQQYSGVINEFLSYTEHCNVIVVALTYSSLAKQNLITRPDLYLAYLDNSNVRSSLMTIEPKEIFLASFLPGYKLTMMNKSYYKVVFKTLFGSVTKDDYLNGFESVNEDWVYENNTKMDTIDCTIDTQIVRKMEQFLKVAEQKEIKVIMVLSPIYIEGQAYFENLDEIVGTFQQVSSVYNGASFINYCDSTICTNKSLFYNYTHMNASGANIFSENISKVVR